MKGGSNIVSFIHHLKIAQEHLEDFIREHSGSKGALLFKKYQERVKWIHNDLITHPFLPQSVRDGIKNEINSDVFAIDSINEKVALLNPALREMIENVLDKVLNGELEIINE